MSWTATLLAGQRDTGRRIFIEPERREVVQPPYADLGPGVQMIAGVARILVRSESFRGNYVYTFRATDYPVPVPEPVCDACKGSGSARYAEISAWRPPARASTFDDLRTQELARALKMVSDLVEDVIFNGHTCPACKPRATFESFL